MAPSCSHAVGAGGYASISQLHPPEVTEGLELFSKHKEWMLFPPLCFPFQQKLKKQVVRGHWRVVATVCLQLEQWVEMQR